MNNGGDAAEQIVRMSLNGVEVAAKITGEGAKNIAILLYTILKDGQQTKGKARLTGMLRSGKELKVFTMRNCDIQKFQKEAKRYGVLYCVLKDKASKDPNAMVDVIARAEDASKISRIVERFKLATVDTAQIVHDAEKNREKQREPDAAQQAAPETAPDVPEQDIPEKSDADKLIDEALAQPLQKETQALENPTAAKTEKSPPSEPSSSIPEQPDPGVAPMTGSSEIGEVEQRNKPSVRSEMSQLQKEVNKVKEQQREKQELGSQRKGKNAADKTEHNSPPQKKKSYRKPKER